MRVELCGLSGSRGVEAARGGHDDVKVGIGTQPVTPAPLAPLVPRGGGQREVTVDDLHRAVDRMNRLSTHMLRRSHLRFQVDEEAQRIRVKVVDSHTGEVIRIVPPASFMENYGRMAESIGLLLDGRL